MGLGKSLNEVEFISFHSNILTEVLVTVHSSGELNEGLVEVEFISFHSNILTEVLVTVHSSGELNEVLVEVEFISVHSGGELSKSMWLWLKWNLSPFMVMSSPRSSS